MSVLAFNSNLITQKRNHIVAEAENTTNNQTISLLWTDVVAIRSTIDNDAGFVPGKEMQKFLCS